MNKKDCYGNGSNNLFFILFMEIFYKNVCLHEPYSSLHLEVLRLIYKAVVRVPRNVKKGEGGVLVMFC